MGAVVSATNPTLKYRILNDDEKKIHVNSDESISKAYNSFVQNNAKITKLQNKLTTIELSAGNYSIEIDNNDDNQLHIEHPVTITGKGKEETIVKGGFWIKSANVCVENLTILKSNVNGVQGFAESSCTLKNINIKDCAHSGVVAIGNNANLVCENIVVSDCNRNGVLAVEGGTITLTGTYTKITKNCSGDINSYGLKVSGENSKIKLENLTKDISKGNEGGRNWYESKENPIEIYTDSLRF